VNGALQPGVYVDCAGWSVPKVYACWFPPSGNHLERYAGRFPAVEINSSFYRSHRPVTYAKSGAAVPGITGSPSRCHGR
jgi:uncharacterized protein YecE (DUF72 family)